MRLTTKAIWQLLLNLPGYSALVLIPPELDEDFDDDPSEVSGPPPEAIDAQIGGGFGSTENPFALQIPLEFDFWPEDVQFLNCRPNTEVVGIHLGARAIFGGSEGVPWNALKAFLPQILPGMRGYTGQVLTLTVANAAGVEVIIRGKRLPTTESE